MGTYIFSVQDKRKYSLSQICTLCFMAPEHPVKGIKGWTRFWGCPDTYCPQTDHVPMNTSLHLVRRLFSKRQLGLKVLRLILTLIVLKTVGRDFQTKAKDI